MRFLQGIATALIGGLILVACGGGGPPSSGKGPASASEAVTKAASCDAIEDIQSYRYTIRIAFQSPAFQAAGSEEDIFSEFSDLLTRFFQDAAIEGTFVAPDRSTVVLRAADEELEVRTIGDRSWLRIGTLWQEQTAAPEEEAILSPRQICENIAKGLGPSLEHLEPQDAVVNGVESRRYHLDAADLSDLATLFPAARGQLPEQFSGDVWLAKEGNWPVRLQVSATAKDEQGQPVSLDMFMEFRDINDPGIEIEPPLLPPPQA